MARTTPSEQKKAARSGGWTAGHIAALCTIVAQSIFDKGDEPEAADAVEGIGELAKKLNNDLLDLAEALA